MELQRSGHNLKIALAMTLAAFVVAYDAYLVVYLIIAGRFPDVWSSETLAIAISALFLALITIGICLNVRTVILGKRQARSLATRDPSSVASATPQPDSALALTPGETLTLARYYSLNAIFRSLTALLFLPGLVFFCELLIFQTLPAFGRSTLNPFYNSSLDGTPASPPTTLDWLAAALPLLLVAGWLGYGAWQVLRDVVSQVSADDIGITVRNGLGRRRRIAWDEISLLARLLEAPRIAPLGAYAIWGRSQSLNFTIPGVEQESDHEPDASAWEVLYVFRGGYNHYIHDARRLLATIVARSQTPLLEMRLTRAPGRQNNRDNALASMTAADALALPLASPLYAPPGATASAMLVAGERVSLRARSAPLPVIGSWGNDFSLGIIVVWILSWIPRLFNAEAFLALALMAYVIVFLALYIILFMRQRRRSHLPDVSADESGITAWGRHKDQPTHIPWRSVTAWVVVPPKRGTTQPFRYVVLGEGLRIGWVEPTHGQYAWRSASSPHGAYRKQAERLHALLAARTDLPLRELHLD
jgi:hypothetical protein